MPTIVVVQEPIRNEPELDVSCFQYATVTTRGEYDMDLAMLDVMPKLVALCRRRARDVRKLATEDTRLCELTFWDEGCIAWWCCYPDELIESIGVVGAEDAAASGELVEQIDALKLDQACAVECGQMRVHIDRLNRTKPACEFGWGAYPKHSNVVLLSRAALRSAAGIFFNLWI